MHDAPARIALVAGITDWLPEDWTLHTTYLACALSAGTILVLQVVLSMFGLFDDGIDVDGGDGVDGLDGADGGDADGGIGLPVLSVRALTSALTVFGLVGVIGTNAGWGAVPTVLIASLSALTILVLVAWLMQLQAKLTQSGTMDARLAVGSVGRVYLRIPPEAQGRGKVTVEVSGRTAEYDAFTEGDAIATGARVRIVRLAAPGYFEVKPASDHAE